MVPTFQCNGCGGGVEAPWDLGQLVWQRDDEGFPAARIESFLRLDSAVFDTEIFIFQTDKKYLRL